MQSHPGNQATKTKLLFFCWRFKNRYSCFIFFYS